MPKMHPRFPQVALTGNKIESAIWKIVDESDLTPAELVRICANITATCATMAVRAERHGDSDKKADEA